MAEGRSGSSLGGIVYWVVAVALTAFGFLALLSIGAPFLLLGVALMLMYPFRRRPKLFWPVVAGVLTFSIVFLLAAPFECEREGVSSTEGVEQEHGTCSSFIGIDYEGVGDWDPSFIPALVGGLAAGGIAAGATWLVVARRTSATPTSSAPSTSR
jgi:hypothetical protein